MLNIMNSAVMMVDGHYACETITCEEAKEMFQSVGDNWKSTIGYPNTKKIVDQILDADVPLSRDSVVFNTGDCALVFSLKYRILSPEEKAQNLHGSKVEDYNIKLVRYQATMLKQGL